MFITKFLPFLFLKPRLYLSALVVYICQCPTFFLILIASFNTSYEQIVKIDLTDLVRCKHS